MTREEAIMIMKNERPHCGEKMTFTEEEKCDAYDMAIEALQREDRLLKSLETNEPLYDMVDVVRCKDCRYFKKIAERSDSGLCHRDIVASAWKENGYCSRGERREP